MKFYEITGETAVEVVETFVTRFRKKVIVATYRTDYHQTRRIKSELTAEQVAEQAKTSLPQELRDWYNSDADYSYSSPEQKRRWHEYHLIREIFRYHDCRPSMAFDGEADRTKFVTTFADTAKKIKVREMTAKEVLDNFSVTDCVEVVQKILMGG